MGLMRNAKGLMIPIGAGRFGRADDPETHISRLNHFGQGMGIDLSSTHPNFNIFSGKDLSSFTLPKSYPRGQHGNRFSFPQNELEFSSHEDEGGDLTAGQIQVARQTLHDEDWSDKSLSIYDELSHRSPYEHKVEQHDNNTMGGLIYKSVSNNDPIAGRDVITDTWGVSDQGKTNEGINFKDSRIGVRTKFNELNRNRKNAEGWSDIDKTVRRVVDHPSAEHTRNWSRKHPHLFGDQFLGVQHTSFFENPEYKNLETDERLEDQVDLKTGNWAKIDPEEYFPD